MRALSVSPSSPASHHTPQAVSHAFTATKAANPHGIGARSVSSASG